MPVCVSYKRLDELEDKLQKRFEPSPEIIDILAALAELRRCRKMLGNLMRKQEMIEE